jgi:hypothetical protein
MGETKQKRRQKGRRLIALPAEPRPDFATRPGLPTNRAAIITAGGRRAFCSNPIAPVMGLIDAGPAA